MADAVQLIPTGGRSGETLLILGILGAGGFLLWRRGAFDKPAPVPSRTPAARTGRPAASMVGTSRDPALPALSAVQQAVTNVSPPVTVAQKQFAAAVRPAVQTAAAGAPPASTGTTSFQADAAAIAASRAKPPPVAAPVGVSASSLMALPSPFGKKPVAIVRPQVAAPTVMAQPPAPLAPRPATLAAPPKASPTLVQSSYVSAGFRAIAKPLVSKPPALTVGLRR